jgi:hypothetical protein
MCRSRMRNMTLGKPCLGLAYTVSILWQLEVGPTYRIYFFNLGILPAFLPLTNRHESLITYSLTTCPYCLLLTTYYLLLLLTSYCLLTHHPIPDTDLHKRTNPLKL